MLTYTVNSNQLAEEDIYAITPVSSLEEFLKPHQSLCIVKAPYQGSIPEMTRVTGKTRGGEAATVYLESAAEERDQGIVKCRLDKALKSPFLFIAWKKKGVHTFRLIGERRTLAEFPDLDAALAAYFPAGFVPEKSFRRNHTVFELMCRVMLRRARFRDLVTVLARWTEKRAASSSPQV